MTVSANASAVPLTMFDDPIHDPGTDAARARAERDGAPNAVIVNTGDGRTIRVGTAGWTDPTTIAPGVFYPADAKTPDGRLRHYASRFSTVEVDSPYYALPTPKNATLWAERTPSDFVFDVKAYALMTGHPTEVARLPKALREALPSTIAKQRRVYPHELPPEIIDEVWAAFRAALQPLIDAGKMGAVLLQYPRWHVPNAAGRDALLEAQTRLPGVPIAAEFRNARWLAPRSADRVLQFLADRGIAYVIVDGPQGLGSSIPPIVAVTSPDLAIVRLHGRRIDQWEKRGALVVDKYRYLYDKEQLDEWAERVVEAARQAKQTRVVFNNCYGNYATTNALEFVAMLSA